MTTVVNTGRGGGKKKIGKFVGKVFNPQAGRPMATLTTPLAEFRATMEWSATQVTTSTSLPIYAAQNVSLGQFPAAAAYTGLFDEYKIEQIEVWLDPSITMGPSTGACMFFSAVDLDDANVPTGYGDVSERQGALASPAGTGHYHKWRPYVANALYSGAFTSYGSEPSPWIDCASSGVQHFGYKVATNAADGVARVYYATVRALISFRGAAI